MPRNSKPWRLLRQVINHDYLVRSIQLEESRILYGEIESLRSWDSHYWLQRGSLEVEHGDLALAENFLSQAKGLAEGDPLVDTEFAYMYFRKAIESPGSSQSTYYVDEAMAILGSQIRSRGRRDNYPFHVLGSQGLAWARRGGLGRREKEILLEKIHLAVEKGCELHGESRHLRKLRDDLKRERLGLKVKPGRL